MFALDHPSTRYSIARATLDATGWQEWMYDGLDRLWAAGYTRSLENPSSVAIKPKAKTGKKRKGKPQKKKADSHGSIC